MASVKEETTSGTKNQPLSAADMAAGMNHEREIAVANAVLNAKIEAQQTFIAQLFERYGVSPETHTLKSWLGGFEPGQAEQ